MEGCEHGEVAAGGFAADEAGEVLVWGRCEGEGSGCDNGRCGFRR